MSVKGKTPQDIRQANHEIFFKLLRVNKALSCTEIAKATKLSNTAIEKIADNLYEKNYIGLYKENYPKVKGRHPIRYELKSEAGVYAGLNFTDGNYFIADFSGEVLATGIIAEVKMWDEDNLSELCAAIKTEAVKFGLPLLSVSAALIGKTDTQTDKIAFSKIFKKGMNLKNELEKGFGVPASVTNDTYLALISELEHNKTKNAVYIYVGKGISCAFVIDGKIYNGGNGIAGEIGHYPSKNGEPIEKILNKKRLFEIDGQLIGNKTDALIDADAIADLSDLTSNILVISRLLDLDDIIIGGSFAALNGYLAGSLNEQLKKIGADDTKASIAKAANISGGLSLSALNFCHAEVIKSLKNN